MELLYLRHCHMLLDIPLQHQIHIGYLSLLCLRPNFFLGLIHLLVVELLHLLLLLILPCLPKVLLYALHHCLNLIGVLPHLPYHGLSLLHIWLILLIWDGVWSSIPGWCTVSSIIRGESWQKHFLRFNISSKGFHYLFIMPLLFLVLKLNCKLAFEGWLRFWWVPEGGRWICAIGDDVLSLFHLAWW